jgi:hypothetical protein
VSPGEDVSEDAGAPTPTGPLSAWPFESYDAYLSFQTARAHSSKRLTQRRRGLHGRLAELIRQHCPTAQSLLCLGARERSEVDRFCEAGFLAEGIDLYDDERITRCDMSDLEGHPRFATRMFDVFVAVHALEHCLNFAGFRTRSLPHCRQALAVVLPVNESGRPTAWDCVAFEFQHPAAAPAAFEQAFPGFRLVHRHIHQNELTFLMLRDSSVG